MYSNGGYLTLNFNGADITSAGLTIDGITLANVIKAKKPIVISNFKIHDKLYVDTFTLSYYSGSAIYLLFFINASTGIERIVINNKNLIYYSSVPLPEATRENLESEVSTNASKSDSNISK